MSTPTPLSPFKFLLPLLKGAIGCFALAVLSAIGGRTLVVSLPLVAREVIHLLVGEAREPSLGEISSNGLTPLLWIALLVVAFHGVLRWAEVYFGSRTAQTVIGDLRDRMYGHLQYLPAGYFDRRPAGRIVLRFVGDANSLQAWISRFCVTAPADLLSLIGATLAIAWIAPGLLGVFVVPLAIAATLILFINPWIRNWTREARKLQSHLCGYLVQRIGENRFVKALNGHKADRQEAHRMINDVVVANLRRAHVDALAQSAATAGVTASLLSLILIGSAQVARGLITSTDVMACLWLALVTRGPVVRLSRANGIHQKARVAIERIQGLLNRSIEPGWSEDLDPLRGLGEHIEARNLGYRWLGGSWLFRGIKFSIRGPGLIAIVCNNDSIGGALLDLMLRIRRPHEGRIKIDGQDIRYIRAADLRRRMILVDGKGRNGEVHLSRAARILASLDRALASEPLIVLLEEPSVGCNADETARLCDQLQRAAKKRLVIVTTNDEQIIRATSQRIELRHASGDDEASIQSN